MFWTLEDCRGEAVTLCDECALEATNMGAGVLLEQEFASMTEASVTLDAMLATIGSGFPVTSSTTGACGNCDRRMEVAQ